MPQFPIMKTDRFSEAIRRKLESIRPEFTEKDWTRMQASLQTGIPQPDPTATGHPFSGGVWSSNPWFLAAASISTAALIAVGVWQRSEINHLRQTVSQLKQQAPAVQVAPASPTPESPTLTQTNGSSPSRKIDSPSTQYEPGEPTRQRDTVYLDRYVTTLAPSGLERMAKEAAPPLTKAPDRGYATTRRALAPTMNLPRRQTNSTLTLQNDTYDVSSTPTSTNNTSLPKSTPSVAANQPENQAVELTRFREKARSKPGRSESYANTNSPIKPDKTVAAQVVPNAPQRESVVEATGAASASYESIAGRPLITKSVNWSALLARQARQMRPTPPTTPAPVAEKATAVQPEERVKHVAIGIRVGAGAEIASQLWGKGIFTEVLLGRNWLLGVGLNQTTYKTTFIDDEDFKDHTNREFRNEFAPHMDPKRTIMSINTQTTRLQIPVYLGYRVPITQAVAFLPTVSTYLNLNNIENATFYSPAFGPQRRYDEFSVTANCPVDLINNLTLGTGVEWQQKHWVAQASPVLTIPFQSSARPQYPQPDWQQSVTLGFRARVLYQF